jgi:hypothetical protein
VSAMPSSDEQRQRHLVRVGLARARMTADELWLRYFSLGGTAGPEELAAYLEGRAELDPVQRDRLALAVNEQLDDLTWDQRVPYVRPVRQIQPETGPLAALTDLLRGTHLRPPEALQSAVDSAARSLGVHATAYLVDHTASTLVPVGGPDRGPALDVDATVAGLAFRRVTTEVSRDGEARLWVPIVDGVERLGVLDVVPGVAADVHDPSLRHECWWFAHYLGHVVEALDRYGDGLEAVRRRGSRNMAADLVSCLLPPLSAGTDKVIVCARVEPSDRMGGDAFDYALSADTAQLGIFDGTGHDLHAGLIAAVALSAYRNARREGRGLFAQVQAVHDTLVEEFGAGAHATGILAQLDLHTGGLRYVCAGHPYPVIMRRGRPVRTLREGRRTLLGVDARSVVVGHEQLEPEDMLVLYTDGITEARDAVRHPFGLEGLTDLLAREYAATTPLPEVVRRVSRAVLRRQGGALQDDATILLAHWTTEGQANLDPAS